MAFLHTHTTALQAGFIRRSPTSMTYFHPKWPGLLFRVVSDFKELVSLGGFIQTHPDGEIVSGGVFNPAALLNPGVILVPALMESHATVLKHGGPPQDDRSFFYDELVTHYRGRTLHVFGSYSDSSSSIGMMAVVTKANGFIWRLNRNYNLTCDLRIPLGGGTGYYPIPNNPTQWSYTVPSVGGKLWIEVKVPLDGMFKRLKTKIMEGVVTNEQKIKDLHSDAFDAVVEYDQFKSGETVQHVSLFAVPGPNGIVHFTDKYPAKQNAFLARFSQTGIEGFIMPGTHAIGGTDNYVHRIMASMECCSESDPIWSGGTQYSNPWVGAHPLPVMSMWFTGNMFWSGDGAGGPNLPDPVTVSFPLNKLPYKAVATAENGQTVEVGGVFGGFTPVVDRSEEGGYTSDFSLSASLSAEIARVDAASNGRADPVFTQGNTAQEQSQTRQEIGRGRAGEAKRREAVNAYLPMCTPIAALILNFVNRWDDKVDELIGEEPLP